MGAGAWVVVIAAVVFWARSDATLGLRAVSAAQHMSTPADLQAARPLPALRNAKSHFESAHRLLGSPALLPVRFMPVLGRQVRSARSLMAAAADVCTIGAGAVDGAREALALSHKDGPGRIALLRKVGEVSARADRRLAAVNLGPANALVRPLESRRAELADKLSRVRRGAHAGALAATAMADMMSGPDSYLMLVANNSEMRAGSGMFLSVGQIDFSVGSLAATDFRPAGDLHLDARVAPDISDPDMAARWGPLNPNLEWRNLGVTPRFDATAPLAARMWPAAGGHPVAGVLALDPVALKAVLAATGPVTVGDRTIDDGNVTDLLLHDQYATLSTVASDLEAAQVRRREQMGLIAKATLGALQKGDWSVAQLASGLADAARGRHILIWSAFEAQQRGWEAAGVAGLLDQSSLMVSVLNRGGNKLDHFLDVRTDLRIAGHAKSADAVLSITIANNAPVGESSYIEGPHPDSGLPAGGYAGLVSVNVPGFAEDVSVDGQTTFAAAGPDGLTKVVAVQLALTRGQKAALTVRFRLPAAHGSLRVEPSARVPGLMWTGAQADWHDDGPHLVRW